MTKLYSIVQMFAIINLLPMISFKVIISRDTMFNFTVQSKIY